MLYAVTAWKWKFGREKERMKVSDVKASRRGPIWRSRCLPAQSLISSGDDPTRDVKAIRVKTGGHHSWTDDEIARFERRHPVGSRARLAHALLLYTGQRRGDVIRMGPQHMRGGAIHVKQEKGGAELVIPIHSELAA